MGGMKGLIQYLMNQQRQAIKELYDRLWFAFRPFQEHYKPELEDLCALILKVLREDKDIRVYKCMKCGEQFESEIIMCWIDGDYLTIKGCRNSICSCGGKIVDATPMPRLLDEIEKFAKLEKTKGGERNGTRCE